MLGKVWNEKIDHTNYIHSENTFTRLAGSIIEDGFF